MAEKVALEVLEKTSQGLKPVVSEIAIKHGYSVTSARTNRPQLTKTYKDIMERDKEHALKNLSIVRKKALARAKKTASTAKFSEAVAAIDTTTKNIQLLTGGSTGEQPVIKIVLFGDTLIAPVNVTKIP